MADNYGQPKQPGWVPPPPHSGPPQQAPPYAPPGQAPYGPPPGNYGQPQGYGAGGTVIVTQPQPQTVVMMGGCPTCRVGVMQDEFTCCGICCAIVFFPIGLLCCWAMREKRCSNCGATF